MHCRNAESTVHGTCHGDNFFHSTKGIFEGTIESIVLGHLNKMTDSKYSEQYINQSINQIYLYSTFQTNQMQFKVLYKR